MTVYSAATWTAAAAARFGTPRFSSWVRSRIVQRFRAVLLVLAAATSVQAGASAAKSLFATLGPPGVVWLRLLFGSIALWAVARPDLRTRPWRELRLVFALGIVLVAMNMAFYESIVRIPLGIAVTVEFLGPLAVATIASRRRLDLVWVALAGLGVALLAEGGSSDVHTLGLLLAAVAGFFWALYITLSVPVGRVFPGASGLAPAMLIGAGLITPWGITSAGSSLRDPQLIGAAAASDFSRRRCRGRSNWKHCGDCRPTSSASCSRSNRRSQH